MPAGRGAARPPAAHDLAFNVLNGNVFRWSWMQGRLVDWFGREAAPSNGTVWPLEQQMAGAAPVRASLAQRHGPVAGDLGRLASARHTDAEPGRPIGVVTDMSRSREIGFLDDQATDEIFFDLFAKLRSARIIT